METCEYIIGAAGEGWGAGAVGRLEEGDALDPGGWLLQLILLYYDVMIYFFIMYITYIVLQHYVS